MTKKIRVVIAQLNLLVGDLSGNLQKHLAAAKTARDHYQADVIVFPELSLTGYPPQDLLLRKDFIEAVQQALQQCKAAITDIYCVIGHPHPTEQGLFNACSLIYNGTLLGRYAKQYLPDYDVFDESRYFISGTAACVLPIRGIPVGLVICEDLWQPAPVQQAVQQGARLILAANASPFESDKHQRRVAILAQRAKDNAIPIVYANQVGGQDELLFDGGSLAVDAAGCLRQIAGFYQEVLHPVDIDIDSTSHVSTIPFHVPHPHEKLYQALVLGVRDYVEKNHFAGVLLGVSGGIDSALTLAIAVDAVGQERVGAVFMPSRYTAAISQEDAIAVTSNLGVTLTTLDIEPIYQHFLTTLTQACSGTLAAITQENLQARCRGVLLMALSNQSGRLVLVTSNRSEMAVGYTTIYGDMAGGFAVLKDVPKTMVYALAHYRNQLAAVIPERTLQRAPSAELAPHQKDEDSLPPYALLDPLLALYLNEEKSLEEIIALGFDRKTVTNIIQLITRSEYKRRQAPVGTRLNYKSFGRDRRYPITSGFKG